MWLCYCNTQIQQPLLYLPLLFLGRPAEEQQAVPAVPRPAGAGADGAGCGLFQSPSGCQAPLINWCSCGGKLPFSSIVW
jgi:hypothetical protein